MHKILLSVVVMRNLETDGRTYPGFSETQQSMNLGHVPRVGEPIPYLSPVRFLPSIMTLLNIRLIRVW
jgi:hypothetical protein